MAERRAELRKGRKTPVQPSQQDRSKPDRKRRPGLRYDTDGYRRAIARACEAAGVPGWHPHQLRHDAATRLRREFGLDTARAVLGHSSTAVTEVYAELDMAKAAAAMERVG
jgi:integrase